MKKILLLLVVSLTLLLTGCVEPKNYTCVVDGVEYENVVRYNLYVNGWDIVFEDGTEMVGNSKTQLYCKEIGG